jgi:hypothetical protein
LFGLASIYVVTLKFLIGVKGYGFDEKRKAKFFDKVWGLGASHFYNYFKDKGFQKISAGHNSRSLAIYFKIVKPQ